MAHNTRLRIAQIAPLIERVPPKKYGGTERVVFALTEELVNRGHEVTLFASGDSTTSAKLASVYPRSLREARIRDLYGLNDLSLLHIGNAYNMDQEFDIIHDHVAPMTLPTAQKSRTPVLVTLHGSFTTTNRHLYSALRNPYVVAISKSQAHSAPEGANIVDVIYNGLAMENYPTSEEPEKYLLFVGRISMEKGTHHAIEVALELNLPLLIAAKLDPTERRYFNEYIEPRLSDQEAGLQIRWIGEVNEEERNRLMSKALCLLHPVTWKGPFGLTIIEALACGCPVVAFNKGSIPEIIQNGKTGFVVEDVVEMIHAVEKIDTIDRKYCREYALGTFNARIMADRYEAAYHAILAKSNKGN